MICYPLLNISLNGGLPLKDFNPQNWSLNNPAKYSQNQDELDKDNPLR